MEHAGSQLLTLGLLMVTGLGAGFFISRFGLPRITAYVAVGVAFSPGLLGGMAGIEAHDWSKPVTAAALGIIAYLIGGSISANQLRRLGKTILGATLGESLGAVLAVLFAMLLIAPTLELGAPTKLALAFAAISATTAPAATIAVLHQYRARGPLSSTLLGVVALDDILGIILFSLVLTLGAGASPGGNLEQAGFNITTSLLLGVVSGWGLALAGRRIHQGGLRLPLILGVIFLDLGLADQWGLSPLLTTMTLGFTCRHFMGAAGDRLFAPVDYFEEMVFLIFFTVAGTHFQAGVFFSYMPLILIYFFSRILGKLGGAWLGTRAIGAPPTIQRWLGLALLPQAGVAVGLALAIGHHPDFQEISPILINVILGTTLLYELIGPLAARFALDQAGELDAKRMGEKP